MSPQLEIALIAIIVSILCSLPGIFLILRNMAMISDSITHTILLGIVLGFFATHDLSSPFLLVGATLVGVLTVWLTEFINKTRLVSQESAIGIVFPLLFSFAVILITNYAGSVHLDTDSVLLGELAFAPFDRLTIFGFSIAKSLVMAITLLCINGSILFIFRKEMIISTFDPVIAKLMGFTPTLLHYGLMTMVSISAVGAFEAVGSVLVVAFMVGPPLSAYLLTYKIQTMCIYTMLICTVTSIVGYIFAILLDISIAGSIATWIGICFIIILIVSPKKGILTNIRNRQKQKRYYLQSIVLVHIYHHMSPLEHNELQLDTIHEHLQWSKTRVEKCIQQLLKRQYINIIQNMALLTDKGIQKVEQSNDIKR